MHDTPFVRLIVCFYWPMLYRYAKRLKNLLLPSSILLKKIKTTENQYTQSVYTYSQVLFKFNFSFCRLTCIYIVACYRIWRIKIFDMWICYTWYNTACHLCGSSRNFLRFYNRERNCIGCNQNVNLLPDDRSLPPTKIFVEPQIAAAWTA